MTIFFAFVSALTMGLFYVLDMFFESRGVYQRPSQAMIISSIVPLLSVPVFVWSPWWQSLSPSFASMALLSGVLLIWANWFYFLVMFPVDKNNREAQAVEGATELALYEGATPALVLVMAMIASQFIVYTDTLSTGQGLAVIVTVLGLILFGMADGYVGFSRWSYRLKLIAFALLVSVSQLLQDSVVNSLQAQGMDTLTAYFSTAPLVWIGMFSGILIVLWQNEWRYFANQFREKIWKYSPIIMIAELIAIASYATLIFSYTGEHVAVAGAIAASFPIIVFTGGLVLQKLGIQAGEAIADTKHISKKVLLILLTLIGVIGVVVL